jgi:hypothetical protein
MRIQSDLLQEDYQELKKESKEVLGKAFPDIIS